MTAYFDFHGWYTDIPMPGREAPEPPAHGPKVVGQPYPNWNFKEWVMIPYAEPIVPAPTTPVRVFTRYEFLTRFTVQERKAIRQLAKQNEDVYDFMDLLTYSTEVRSDNQDVINALDALTAAGVLAPGRKAQILGD